MSSPRRISNVATSTPSPAPACRSWLTSSFTKGLSVSARTANRCKPGTISRRRSGRLPETSGIWLDSPVTLPSGRARLATMPLPTGSPAVANTIGIVDVACFAARGSRSVVGDDDVDLEPNKLVCEISQTLGVPLGPAILDREITALHPAQVANSMHEGGGPLALCRRATSAEQSDSRRLRLLGTRGERPSRRHATKQRDEVPPSHCQVPPPCWRSKR